MDVYLAKSQSNSIDPDDLLAPAPVTAPRELGGVANKLFMRSCSIFPCFRGRGILKKTAPISSSSYKMKIHENQSYVHVYYLGKL